MQIARIGGYLALSVLGGMLGALFITKLSNSKNATIQTQRLEITDIQGNVRATLSADNDGSVSLRMLSQEHKPIISLGVGTGAYIYNSSAASLTMNNAAGETSLSLRTEPDGEGALTFADGRVPDRVSVGYADVGDVDDGHKRGSWGWRVLGPNHQARGSMVFVEDGVMQGFEIPLKPPPRIKQAK